MAEQRGGRPVAASQRPTGGDKAIAAKIHEVVVKALAEPDTQKLLLGQGLDPVGSSPDEFGHMYTTEIARWSKVVKAVGLEPN